MSVYELAKQYYPRLWKKGRLVALVETGKLTAEQYEALTGEAYGEEEVE